MSSEIPLYRAISKLGYASRNNAFAMITAGEIRVDGKLCIDPYVTVPLDKARICHKQHLIIREKLRVILLYKPKGVITSSKDEMNRPTIYTFLPPDYHHLHSIGRLDFATSGLLLLTNNTRLSSWLTDPLNRVPRVYVVTVRGLISPEKTQKMISGIIDDGQTLKTDAVVVRKASNRESHLVITLTEGKNREIRRICSSMGNEVTRLKRVSYGPFTLGAMAPGEFRNVAVEELNDAFPQFRNTLN